MNAHFLRVSLSCILLLGLSAYAQEKTPGKANHTYYFGETAAFDEAIPKPGDFLNHEIGSRHTRHDEMVAYFRELSRVSDRASLEILGHTYEGRPLMMLAISAPEHIQQLASIQETQQKLVDPSLPEIPDATHPVLVNLGYNVHGNEPSGGEAALLTAYYLVAGESEEAKKFRQEAVVFIDPVINPDGRDRHTHWANMHQGTPLVSDPLDREHNEAWPGGRTNHYWFDLNRDWLLAVHPESQSKLAWYHQWYPNVVTDFHEMGTSSHYFFEPMKAIGSKDPIMPKENYTTLNDKFAAYFEGAMNQLGSLYFSKERFDGTYPGYGSSYPDLQGGLGILFEQASSRGLLQKTRMGYVGFPFTIRNQYTNSLATVRAAVAEKAYLFQYQKDFFKSALSRAQADPVKAYVFGEKADNSRLRAFLQMLMRHQIEVRPCTRTMTINGTSYEPGEAYVVPTFQPQYRMVQSMFETYDEYRDSVFYDASAWSLVNAYGLAYQAMKRPVSDVGDVLSPSVAVDLPTLEEKAYGYILPWEDYFAPKALYSLLQKGIKAKVAFRPFQVEGKSFSAGSIFIPGGPINDSPELLAQLNAVTTASGQAFIPVQTGYSQAGLDLGSTYFRPLDLPKALMMVGEGVSGYEAGEVWHVLDRRVAMPITKVDMTDFNRIRWADYNTLVLVSGRYSQWGEAEIKRIKDWISTGGTLITTRQATQWAIQKKLVDEKLISQPKDSLFGDKRRPFTGLEKNAGI
ncbi:MAG: M14 family zinc carboxypeptidase [Bacteroidota bacterium]